MSAPRAIAPRFVERVWGAFDLSPLFGKQEQRIGEVWYEAGPLLIKFLFTTAALSVQVHPDDDWAEKLEGVPVGKTEMWYVLRADPNAQIALGFRELVSQEAARAAALDGGIENMLRWWDAKPGDAFFTPARTVHALGAGLIVLEIQQQSDLTYRLYDYGRPRELHLEKGFAVADLCPHPGKSVPRPIGDGGLELVRCPYFVAERWNTSSALRSDYDSVVIVLEGDSELGGPGTVCEVGKGEKIQPIGPAVFLRTYVPPA